MSGLLHSVWQSLGPSMLLQMALFCSFLWLIYSIVCVCHILFIHSSVDGHLGCLGTGNVLSLIEVVGHGCSFNFLPSSFPPSPSSFLPSLPFFFGCAGSLLQHAGSFSWGMQTLSCGMHVGSSSMARDWARVSALGAQSLAHWTTREVPEYYSLNCSCILYVMYKHTYILYLI